MRLKRFLHTVCALVMALVLFVSVQAVYADVLFEPSRRPESPHPGIIYEHIRQMTTRGILDIHVLLIPLDDPYIYIGPVASERAPGLRETATSLLSAAGAVAGINADFFGLAGSYSVHFGPMIMDGEVLGINTNTNHNGNEFAAFFLDMDNNPFFEYMQARVRFYNNDTRNVNIASINVIGHELRFPVIVDRLLTDSTRLLMDRFYGLTKIVVAGNEITEITQNAVTVPYDGYVLILPANMYETHLHYFNVGDSARLRVSNNADIDFSGIQAAIGGGGMILSEGQTVSDSGVAPYARHPRSAVGVTRDGNTLILMVVDGRNHSVGATHNEMASLLRRFGAWDAMHFDGGGSSTMVIREWGGTYAVVNTPSDGAQRRIINALGVFDSRPFNDDYVYRPYVPAQRLAELRGRPSVIAAIEDQEVQLHFSGVTDTGEHIPSISLSNISNFTVVPSALGRIENGVFIAGSQPGTGHLAVSSEGINTYIPVTVGGNSRALSFVGADLDFIGYPAANVTGSASVEGQNIRFNYGFAESSSTQAAHLSFYPPIQLPNRTIALNLQVDGNGTGHWLRGRVLDGVGRRHNIDFTRDMDFNGWQTLIATLPTDAPGPFTLDRLYTVALEASEASQHSVRFTGLEAVVAPSPPDNIPQGPVFIDPLWAGRGFDNAPGERVRFDLPTDETGYNFSRLGRFSATTLTLYGGRLGNDQWRRLVRDITSSNPDYVVILMDDNPLTAFSQSAEFELFHMAMEDLRDQGRMVFVVSATGTETIISIMGGIRYINLARTREYIRFRTYGEEIWWAG